MRPGRQAVIRAAGFAVAAVLLGAAIAAAEARGAPPPGMVRIPAGTYAPLYVPPPPDTGNGTRPDPRVRVAAFDLDVRPITNRQFLRFVSLHPEWRRSRVKPVFADASYLQSWKADLEPGDLAAPDSPVVHISWFAARAYLRTAGKRLPTVDEWEYAGAASETRRDASRDSAFLERLRKTYSRPTPERLPPVGSFFRNLYGVEDMHGAIWEWTLDFNSALVTGESRADASVERSLFCGGGASGAADFANYAAFMRYAFRASLEARYCIANLGFRGAATPVRDTP